MAAQEQGQLPVAQVFAVTLEEPLKWSSKGFSTSSARAVICLKWRLQAMEGSLDFCHPEGFKEEHVRQRPGGAL